jgi:hypothetical protein
MFSFIVEGYSWEEHRLERAKRMADVLIWGEWENPSSEEFLASSLLGFWAEMCKSTQLLSDKPSYTSLLLPTGTISLEASPLSPFIVSNLFNPPEIPIPSGKKDTPTRLQTRDERNWSNEAQAAWYL